MKALCVHNKSQHRARSQERVRRRIARLVEETTTEQRARDLAVARLVTVLEHAYAEEIPHLVGRYRIGDEYSRLARLRAAHAVYALATMPGMERAGEGAFVRA